MSLFSNMMGFGRPGPGVRPDEPRKKGMLRLLEILSRDMWSFFRAGFLALVSFIPFMVLVMLAIDTRALIFVLAAGLIGGPLAMPQIVGLADTVLRSLRDEPGYWWVTYRRAWKRNLKACVVPGILCGLLLAMQVFLFFILLETGTSSPSWVATIVGFFITLGLTFYIVPQLALVDLPLLAYRYYTATDAETGTRANRSMTSLPTRPAWRAEPQATMWMFRRSWKISSVRPHSSSRGRSPSSRGEMVSRRALGCSMISLIIKCS